MDWEQHILTLHKAAIRISSWILNIFHSRDKLVLMTLFNSLVRSKLEYACQLWDPTRVKLIDLLENIQRSFTRKIYNMSDLDYWSRLKKLGIMSLQRRREKLIIIMTFKIKNKLIPNDINLEFKEHKHKSHTLAVLKPLPRVKGKLLTIFENSFLIKSAKLWNKLPQQLTKIPNLLLFEKQLD